MANMQTELDKWGHAVSYVEVAVAAGGKAIVTVN